MINIVFYSAKPYVQESFSLFNSNNQFNFKFFEFGINAQNAVLAKDSEVVCCFVNDVLDYKVLKILKDGGCKLIALRCAGYNNVDLEAAKELNLPVVRVPEYSPYGVAEHAVAMLLTLNRKTHKAYNRVRDLNFNIDGLLGFDLHGKTIGVIGTGKIGKVFIKICKGFGLNVIAYDLYPDHKAAEDLQFKYVDLATLYKTSDIISLWCPLTKDSHHIINEKSIVQMKDGVFLINTSRGGLVDTSAVIEYLKNGKISALALDVYEEEEKYFFEDLSKTAAVKDDTLSRLLTFNNVLVTSHQAFFTKEAIASIAKVTTDNIIQYLQNNKLQNAI